MSLGMEGFLPYVLYAVIAALFATLAWGVINLTRRDAKAASRSNKIMRLRVLLQFVAVVLVVIIGWLAGAFNR